MKEFLSKNLIKLAESLPKPLYVVGGLVRNYHICKKENLDFEKICLKNSFDCDLASPLTVEELLPYLTDCGFFVVATYKRTNTVVFKEDGNLHYEFTTFRTEKYHGGEHTPYEVVPTTDILLDAKRRDFKCNAVYYDIKKGETVDPLGGLVDIKNGVLSTADTPEKVFSFDGLRLLRLARFAGELNFKVDKDTLISAKEHRNNIDQIVPERIYEELKRILVADKKYLFSDKSGHYTALKVLDEIRVLDRIIPELTLGRNLLQRKDFHNYDVLEHSLRTVFYADEKVRLSALFHDVGKPYAMKTYGKYASHPFDGEKIAIEVLERLKAPKKVIEEVAHLTKWHMYDVDMKAKEKKVRLFIADNIDYLDRFLLLKQADFSACKDDLSVAPTVKKWREIYQKMVSENVPFKLNDLAVNGKDIQKLGINGQEISKTLNLLRKECILNPTLNEKEKLISLAVRLKNKPQKF